MAAAAAVASSSGNSGCSIFVFVCLNLFSLTFFLVTPNFVFTSMMYPLCSVFLKVPHQSCQHLVFCHISVIGKSAVSSEPPEEEHIK